MKVLNAFTDANSGRLVMPGEAYDEKSIEPEELERLKAGNYLGDGDGSKPGEGKLEDLSLTDLKATGRAYGLDVENIRSKDRLIAAINAGRVEPYRVPPGPAPKDEGVVTIGKGVRAGPTIDSRPVQQTPEATRTPAAAAAQTRGDAPSSQPAGREAPARGGAPVQGSTANPATRSAGPGATTRGTT